MPASPYSLILTRPAGPTQAMLPAWQSRFPEASFVLSPLIEIVPVVSSDALEARCRDAHGLVFTSARAVEIAGALCRDRPVWAVGGATAAAAKAQGGHVTQADGDAEALVALLLETAPGGKLLHLRGQHARGKVAERLRAGGVSVDELVTYDQVLLPLSSEALTRLKGSNPCIVPLFSPRTAGQFAREHAGGAPCLIAALSPAVADGLGSFDPTRIAVAKHPNEASIMTATAELIASVSPLETARGDR